ncbi:hypothetical protein V8C26DRAFT_335698 [Trichoderma gracile]
MHDTTVTVRAGGQVHRVGPFRRLSPLPRTPPWHPTLFPHGPRADNSTWVVGERPGGCESWRMTAGAASQRAFFGHTQRRYSTFFPPLHGVCRVVFFWVDGRGVALQPPVAAFSNGRLQTFRSLPFELCLIDRARGGLAAICASCKSAIRGSVSRLWLLLAACGSAAKLLWPPKGRPVSDDHVQRQYGDGPCHAPRAVAVRVLLVVFPSAVRIASRHGRLFGRLPGSLVLVLAVGKDLVMGLFARLQHGRPNIAKTASSSNLAPVVGLDRIMRSPHAAWPARARD